jgi:hypothetical protein
MTIPGNHEDYQNTTHYSARYIMPENDANEGLPLFYSFNLGHAHYILFDTEVYFGLKNTGAVET